MSKNERKEGVGVISLNREITEIGLKNHTGIFFPKIMKYPIIYGLRVLLVRQEIKKD